MSLAFDLLLWALIALSFDLNEPLVAIDYWYGFRLKLLIYVFGICFRLVYY